MIKTGDYVRGDSGVEGFVERIVDDNLQILKFTKSASREALEGPDVTIDQIPKTNVKRIDKEDIHRDAFSHYHQLDYQWRTTDTFLTKFNPNHLTIGSDFEIFYPADCNKPGFFKVNETNLTDLYWCDENWVRVNSLGFKAANVIEVEVNGQLLRVSSDSWRIRQVLFCYICYLGDKENHINIKQLSDPKSPRKIHRCSADCIKDIIRAARANVSRDFQDNIPWKIVEKFGIKRHVEIVQSKDEKEAKHVVVYTTACKKEIRNDDELQTWFIDTKMKPRDLQMTNFDFNPKKTKETRVIITKEGENLVYPDLSGGRENYNIPVVAKPKNGRNYRPPKILYPRVKALEIPKYISDDEYNDFLICCDCKDGCQPLTCACMKLTQEGYENTLDFRDIIRPLKKQLESGEISQDVYNVNYQRAKRNCGYQQGLIQRNKEEDKDIFNRGFNLNKSICSTGIYECHSGCACKDGWCNNRIVQNGIKTPMIAFRTTGKDDDESKSCGWGIRAACDIKAGTYLCDYFGALHFEFPHFAWDKGQFFVSETAAQLNFIEIAEANKVTPKPSDEGYDDEHNNDDHNFSDTRILMDRLHGCVVTPKYEEYKVNPHMRQYARPFVDASEEGNIGRFFNHSCSPNIMIQNVFTDHQDQRFPHTSFFTTRNIKAGEELRWNYGYENNQTEGGECYCESNNCNGFYK